MKVTQFDKATCRKMADDLANLLKEFEREWGVRVEYKGGRFSSTMFKPRIEVHVLAANGEKKLDIGAVDWQTHAVHLGLRLEWLGQMVTIKGKTLKVIGLKANRPKKPVLLGDGARQYKCSIETLKYHLGAKAA